MLRQSEKAVEGVGSRKAALRYDAEQKMKQNNIRRIVACFFRFDLTECADNDTITDLKMTCGCAVNANGFRATWGFDRIGHDAGTCRHVPDVNLLVRKNASLVEKVFQSRTRDGLG